MLESSQEWTLTEIDATTVERWLKSGHAVLIDVREREEFDEERIPGSTSIPLSSFDPCLLNGLIGTRVVVIHCLAGSRAQKAAEALARAGYAAPALIKDGLLGWKSAGFTTET